MVGGHRLTAERRKAGGVLAARYLPTIVRDAVITHLTFAEGLGPLLSTVAPRPMTNAP